MRQHNNNHRDCYYFKLEYVKKKTGTKTALLFKMKQCELS